LSRADVSTCATQDVKEEIVSTNKISRRDFVKLGIASGVSLIASGLVRQQDADAYSNGCYYGIDGNTSFCCSMPKEFYIGQMGYGTTNSTAVFNVASAQAVGTGRTYGYWSLQGTQYKPANRTAYQWGQDQGNAAARAWDGGHPYSYLIYGTTIFADIEAGLGWSTTTKTDNREIVRGFLNAVATYVPCCGYSLNPGVYTRPSAYQSYFYSGDGWKFPRAVPIWLWCSSGCQYAITCAPCDNSCGTTLSEVCNAFPTYQAYVIGGYKVVIWQYWIQGAGCSPACNDWDATKQNPANSYFSGVSAATDFSAGCS
jgi:hypothetical protein